MAFNRVVFLQRAVTAFFFVLVMLTGLCYSDWSFMLLIMVLHAGCWVEYQRLYLSFRYPLRYLLSGFFYLSLSWVLFMDLRFNDPLTAGLSVDWPLLPLFVLACMWINDTMAYLTGSLIGRTPLTAISPKKTWEGTLGGVVLTVIVAGWSLAQITPLSGTHGYLMALLAAIAGTLGDLFESKLKRMAGVKDSGSIMPGHGGFLDRFDSLLLATPVIWLYCRLCL